TDPGINEVESETSETYTFCGIAQGIPRCSDTMMTSYEGVRELMHDDAPDDGTKHDLWSKTWKLSVTITAADVRIANAGAALPKGPKGLIGTHRLAW
ncbi:MAG: hypothetical protein ACI9U2_004460, partial [Bradymonadia bacterium]